MKKFLALLMAACMLLTAVPALAEDSAVAAIVAGAAEMTHDELVEKAMAEEGTFIVYGNTSRIANAVEAFAALYGIDQASSNLKDAEIYTKLESEISG